MNVDPIVRTIQPGGVVQFKGQIINNNAYPIVDGSVYVKIFREESQNRVNALPLVDQFVAKEGINLSAHGTSTIEFDWVSPLSIMSGSYKAAMYFQSADEFSLLGLSFTNDIIGNTSNFTVTGNNKTGVYLSKDDVLVEGKQFMFAGFPPRVNSTTTVPVSAYLVNTTNQNHNVLVTWSIFRWDGLKKENLIEQKSGFYTVKPGRMAITLDVTQKDYPVYYIVAEASYKNSKSILDIRFIRDEVPDARLNFMGVDSYPVKNKDQTSAIVCMHAVSDHELPGGKLELSVIDEKGKVVSSSLYEGPIDFNMMGFKSIFARENNLNVFTLRANLYKDGKLKDAAQIVYNCKDIDKSLCAPEDKFSLIYFVVISIIILAVILIIVPKRKRVLFAILLSISFFGFGSVSEAKTVTWSGTNEWPMYIKNFNGEHHCMLYTGSVHTTDRGWNVAATDPDAENDCRTERNYGSPVSMQVTYGARVYNTTTGSEVELADGATVEPNSKIRLRFTPYNNTDIYWSGTAAYVGSPYGYWVANAAAPNTTPAASDSTGFSSSGRLPIGTGGTQVGGLAYTIYVAMSVNPSTKTVSNQTGLSCGSLTTSASGDYMDCTVTAANNSTISPNFNFAATTAQFRNVFGLKTNYSIEFNKDYPKADGTYVPETHNVSWKRDGDAAFGMYVQDVAAQTIPFSLSVKAAVIQPPTNVNGTCPGSGTSGSITWSAPAIAPDTYTVKVTDKTLGGVPTSYSGLTTTSKDVTTVAGHAYTFTVAAVKGGVSSSEVSGSFSCVVSAVDCTGTVPNNVSTFACPNTAISSEVSTAWSNVGTAASCPTGAANVCKYYSGATCNASALPAGALVCRNTSSDKLGAWSMATPDQCLSTNGLVDAAANCKYYDPVSCTNNGKIVKNPVTLQLYSGIYKSNFVPPLPYDRVWWRDILGVEKDIRATTSPVTVLMTPGPKSIISSIYYVSAAGGNQYYTSTGRCNFTVDTGCIEGAVIGSCSTQKNV